MIEEIKEKIRKNHKGMLGKHHSEETKRKIGKAFKGKKLTEEHKRKVSEALKGHKPAIFSEETKKRISNTLKETYKIIGKPNPPHYKGENHYNWKGGITSINQKIRNSLEYKLWEDSVLSRDGYCCLRCSKNRIRNLMGHHIQNFANFPELRTSIENGITFCKNCHQEFHKIYGRKNNTKEQLEEFLDKK